MQDVKVSTKLVDSACCLVAPDTGMDVQMERIMKIQNKDFKGMPRILEINPDHNIIKKLNKIKDTDKDALNDASFLLFDQAKMVEGRVNKYLSEVSLVKQPFVKDPNQSIQNLLNENNSKVISFIRLEVGEGIEVEQKDFAAEVAATVNQ